MSLLTNVSQQMPNQANVKNVAKALDYQPLALACAAWYVYSVRSRGSSHFNWETYLDKLNRGKEEAMGEIKRKCDYDYTKSMPVAVRMAVEREVVNEPVLLQTFHLRSRTDSTGSCRQFVAKRTPDLDEEDIIAKIMESSLVQISCTKDGEQTLWLRLVLYHITRSDQKAVSNQERRLK